MKEKINIEKLTIGDVLSMKEYEEQLQAIVNELRASRNSARVNAAKSSDKLKRHPIDILTESGLWHVGFLIGAYREILDKCSPYSRTLRTFVRDVCTEAFNKTMNKLLQDEKDANTSDGND